MRRNSPLRARKGSRLRHAEIHFGLLFFFAIVIVLLGFIEWYKLENKPREVTAYLQIKYDPEATVRENSIFRETQRALINSDFVLNNALSRAQVAQLACVLEREDSLIWISENLEVSIPGDGEIMEVVLRGEEHELKDLCIVLDAVIEAYTNEVIFKARTRHEETQESMRKLSIQLARELEEKYDRFARLKKELGKEADESGKLVLLEDEVDQLRKVRSQMQANIRTWDLEAKKSIDRIQILQQATYSLEN